MAYADIMAKVLSATFTLLLTSRALMAGMMIVVDWFSTIIAIHIKLLSFESLELPRWRGWRWRRSKELWSRSSLKLKLCVSFICFYSLQYNNVLLVVLFIMKRKKKWRSRNCCISRLVFITEELQRWFFKPSVRAKVGYTQLNKLVYTKTILKI